MTTTTRRYRVISHAFVNGMHGTLPLSLSDAREKIRSARRHADRFHTYEFTDRNGTRRHVAYARYLPGSPKHGYSKVDPHMDVTCLYEATAEAVAAAFGLTPAA